MGLFASMGNADPQPGQLSILVFGAHPDDCDFRCGGMAMKYRALGHRVRFVSMTNGDTGHFSQGGGPLARRRYEEAQASARIAGIEYDVWDIHNGELEPSVLMRKWAIQTMRRCKADIVVCHRANDYHPDHRAVGVIVQDAAYTVTVPNVAPLTPHLERAPVVCYAWDGFRLPNPFECHVAIDTDDVFERKIDMAHCHVSQVYEWLPFNGGILDQVPTGDAERREWYAPRLYGRFENVANSVRDTLIEFYGPERGKTIRTAEALMISEYGRRPAPEEIPVLFPFFPSQD